MPAAANIVPHSPSNGNAVLASAPEKAEEATVISAVLASAPEKAEEATVMSAEQVKFCKKVEREILRYGVNGAMERWRVVCDYMQTEDWWPSVAREVEVVFDAAYVAYNNRLEKMANRQSVPLVQLNNNPAASNPVGIHNADQAIVSNMGDVTHTKYQ